MNTARTANNLPAQAILYAGIRQNAKVPYCGMCTGDRQIVEQDGVRYVYCARCNDSVPESETKMGGAR